MIKIREFFQDIFRYQKDYRLSIKETVFIIIGVIVVFSSVFTYWIISDQRATQRVLNKNFAGSVKNIYYDLKQFPTVTIGDSDYYIGAGYHTNHQIEVGDSIIKKRGSAIYTLIKHKTHKTIEFK